MTVFLSCLRDVVVICRTVITLRRSGFSQPCPSRTLDFYVARLPPYQQESDLGRSFVFDIKYTITPVCGGDFHESGAI